MRAKEAQGGERDRGAGSKGERREKEARGSGEVEGEREWRGG